MNGTAEPIASPTLTPEVLVFAAQQGALPYLRPLLEMTNQVFQGRPVTVSVDEDPEIADERHIVIDADVTGLTAEQMFECQQRWQKESFDHCPAALVCVFCLGMVDSA